MCFPTEFVEISSETVQLLEATGFDTLAAAQVSHAISVREFGNVD